MAGHEREGMSRRGFLAGMSFGAAAWAARGSEGGEVSAPPARKKTGARVRAAFLYPPSKTFADDPNGWWSWPGNEFDAEGRERSYTAALRAIEKKLGMEIEVGEKPIATTEDARRLAAEIAEKKPDGLLIMMFYNQSLGHADLLLDAAAKLGIPAIFFIGLGVKHGPITAYRRPGVYLIQSLDNLEAIEYGLRMINARKLLAQSLLLSITEADAPREGTEGFFGIRVRVIPFARYAERFRQVEIDARVRDWIRALSGGATEIRGVSAEAFENAARAHFALVRMLEEEGADGLTMNCLRRGMLKPCISFSMLNGALVPAACENDSPAAYTQLLGQLLFGRPGFQHNPCYETERNHYYASHCTCATKLLGPDGPERPYLLRRFAHTNEGSCAIQVFWKPGDPVAMVRYHPGEEPALDVYAGKVVASHPMPPAAGCTTNVEIEITDREDACQVKGHHNLIFCGDLARRFRLFAGLHKLKLAETGGPV
ncbi:MAG: hypothetical protein JXP34_28165 [Planctomycetes bacterium]|nr:hypothetical protein [Planctomycetota bacterium]